MSYFIHLSNDIPIDDQTRELRLRARLYPAWNSWPRQVLVNSRQASFRTHRTRYPFPENHLGENTIQPYVHNCIVTVYEAGHKYQFMVFFKRHAYLKESRSLLALLQGCPMLLKGDAIVMRMGSLASYVNMRDRDTILADWLMKQ